MAEKRRGLGRGLGALIPNAAKEDITTAEAASPSTQESKAPRAAAEKNSTAKTAASKTTAPKTASKPSRAKATTADALFDEPVKPSPKSSGEPASAETPKQNAVEKNTETVGNIKNVAEQTEAFETPAQKNKTAADDQQSPTAKSSAGTNVSRETPKNTSRSTKKNRVDMGTALRNTTAARRPVDFFFGEDTEAEDRKLMPVPGAEFAEIDVKDIHPNRKQPRTEFDEQDMEELVHSIREIGVLQPIVVRPSHEKGAERYELVMGERRWRATQRAGLTKIPAIVRNTQDVDLLRDALLENLHRSQLNPIEEAAAYQQLLEEFDTTQDQLAQRIGRSRPQISNTLRLLKLPALVQRRVAAGVLSSGHARALLGLKSQAEIERIAQKVVNEGLSVRSVEELVALSTEQTKKERKESQPQKHHERLDYIADAFADKLDTNVKIQLGARKGKMMIEFASVEDLNRIISVLDPKMSK